MQMIEYELESQVKGGEVVDERGEVKVGEQIGDVDE